MAKTDDILIYPVTKAIAQGILRKVLPSSVEEISPDELAKYPSERGSGALGSSNK